MTSRTAWLTYAADRSLLKIAQDTAAPVHSISVRLTRARLEGGISPRTDLRQAEQILETANADLSPSRPPSSRRTSTHCSYSSARPSNSGCCRPRSTEAEPDDSHRCRRGSTAASCCAAPTWCRRNTNCAPPTRRSAPRRAALFPRISLTGIVGFASTALSSLFSGGAFNYSVAPSVSYPIFRAGAGVAGVRYSQAQRDAALATYERIDPGRLPGNRRCTRPSGNDRRAAARECQRPGCRPRIR